MVFLMFAGSHTPSRVRTIAGRVLLTAALLAGVGLAVQSSPVGAATGFTQIDRSYTVTEHSILDTLGPNRVVTGPDGSVWQTYGLSSSIGVFRPDGSRQKYDTPTPSASPLGLTFAPDGALWFAELSGNKIGRLDSAGAITEYDLPHADSEPTDIVVGPDGNLWFTEDAGNRIGTITTDGVVTEFDVPTLASKPGGITAGPDGNLWFTEQDGNKIGRITPTGTITEFDLPTPASVPTSITAGPDGNLWFTQFGTSRLGQIAVDGVITEFDLPVGSGPAGISSNGTNLLIALQTDDQIVEVTTAGTTLATYDLNDSSLPSDVVEGTDGTLWAAEPGASRLAQITTGPPPVEILELPHTDDPGALATGGDGNVWVGVTGAILRVTESGDVTRFPLAAADSDVSGMALGDDGNIWFTETHFAGITRITPEGVQTPYPFADGGSGLGVTAGPDGNIWFTQPDDGHIGRITPAGVLLPVLVVPVVAPATSAPDSITTGPDGRMWFTDTAANAVRAVSTDGDFSPAYVIDLTGSGPEGIVAAPDGTLRFGLFNGQALGTATTAGVITTSNLSSNITDVAVGSDDNIWTSYFNTGKIGRVDSAGNLDDFQTLPGVQLELANGPDGNMWFVSYSNDGERAHSTVGRIMLPVVPPLPPEPPVPPVDPVVPVTPLTPVVTPKFTG